jgi:outer membrane protein assembly factor BamB
LAAPGDLSNTDSILWTWNKKTPYVPSPLLYDGRIYLFSANGEILSCFDAKSGKPLIDGWRVEGLVGVFASPVAAADRILLTGRNGVTVVIKASDHFEPIATNQLDDRFEASPAIAGKEIFLRGRQSLYCIADQ